MLGGLRYKRLAIWLITILALMALTAVFGFACSIICAIIIFICWVCRVVTEHEEIFGSGNGGKDTWQRELTEDLGDDDWYYEARFIWGILKD